jgi:uncharacterized protein
VSHVVLWRRLDVPGHDTARLWLREGKLPTLEGVAVFRWEGRPCRLDYAVACDAEWRTVRVAAIGWLGDRQLEAELAADGHRAWWLQRERCDEVSGCDDVDLAFTPATNALAIRRLALEIGETAETTAAWLRFPELSLEPLRQSYRKLSETTYAYEAPDLGFSAELEVDAEGFVTRYPGLWEAER